MIGAQSLSGMVRMVEAVLVALQASSGSSDSALGNGTELHDRRVLSSCSSPIQVELAPGSDDLFVDGGQLSLHRWFSRLVLRSNRLGTALFGHLCLR